MENYNYFDKVLINTKENETTGTVIKNPDDSTILIKLDNGYNTAIPKKDIISLKILDKSKELKEFKETNRMIIVEEKEKNTKTDPNKKTIAILHCGGTVASKVDYKTGGVTANFSPNELVKLFPELKDLANIKSKLVRQMMSENMRFAHYNLIAQEIKKQISEGTDGIIVTHGTDTLHYTSAALAFMLENINIPIILVGSQKSSDRGSSDAHQNLISAAYFITNTDFKGTAICMHETTEDQTCMIIPGCKARKMHSSRRDAFRPINALPIAKINYEEKKITFTDENYEKQDTNKKSNSKLTIKLFKENLKVGFVKCHPNMFAEEVKVYENFDGLVLEGTGLGQIPNSKIDEFTGESEKIIKVVKEMTKKIPVALAVQTIYGKINMNTYKEGRINLNAGVIGNHSDMTPETTFIKLAWLISNYKTEEVKKLLTVNMRGELSKTSHNNTFLI